MDEELCLPAASGQRFWRHGALWEPPDFDQAETFVTRLLREGLLVQEPLVRAAFGQGSQGIPARTLRHHFARGTGLTATHVRQVNRARKAATLLKRGVPIADLASQLGYSDQPHLTRSLRRFVGRTPARFLRFHTMG